MTADPTNLGLFAAAQHRTGNRAGALRFLGIGHRQLTGQAGRPILLAAPDLPGEDARQYARDVRKAPSAVTPGRGLEREPANEWDEYIAPVLELRGPRRHMCAAQCGRPGTYRDPMRPGNQWCADDKPAGLTVVDGGNGGAA